MKNLFESLRKPSRLMVLVLGCALALVYAIVCFATMGDDFLEVMSNIVLFALFFVAYGATPLLLILNRDKAAKVVFSVVTSYLLISLLLINFEYARMVSNGSDGLFVTIGVFGFLVGLAIAGAGVLLVLSLVLNKENLKLYALLTLIGAILFEDVLVILILVEYIMNSGAWVIYFELVFEMLIPLLALFGYLCFFGVPNADINKPKKDEKVPEAVPVEEEPKEEQPIEEVPPQEEQPVVDINKEEEQNPEEKPE